MSLRNRLARVENMANKYDESTIPGSFAERIEAMIPKSLDDVIRKNRHLAQVRHANQDDLLSLLGTVNAEYPDCVITNWHLVTIATPKGVGFDDMKNITMLLGERADGTIGNTWITSAIVKLDLASGYLLTNSGSLYMMAKKGEGEPSFEQLALLCRRIHKYGAGEFFGVPEYF